MTHLCVRSEQWPFLAAISLTVLFTACATSDAREVPARSSTSVFADVAPLTVVPIEDEQDVPNGDTALVPTARAHRSRAPRQSPRPEAPTQGVKEWAARPQERPNVVTDFSPEISAPRVHPTSYLDPIASIIGAVEIGARVYIAPFASLRGDEGQPIHLGDDTNVQDGVVIHALETIADGHGRLENTWLVDGERYAVYVGNRVSLAHQSQVHGPAWIEDGVFVGMKALVFKAHVGRGAVIEPAANVIGVTIPAGRYVEAGTTVSDQAAADSLPVITERYAFRSLNDAVIHVNTSLAGAYRGRPAAPNPAPPHAPLAVSDNPVRKPR